MNRNRIIVAIVIAIVLIAGLLITEPWTYFVVNQVDEAFPELSTDQRDAINNMPEDQKGELLAIAKDNPDMAQEVAVALTGDDTIVPEDEQTMPDDMPSEPTVLKSGSFITIDAIHGAEGSATIYAIPDSSPVLRFEDFKSTNGPELHVILSKEVPTGTFAGIGDDTIDLGLLKGNVGNQNYEIPADIDLDEYKSIVIYCVPFGVVFSSADISG